MDPTTYDAPAITILKGKRVHARFSHTCACCSLPIQRGELHNYYAFTDDEALGGPKARLRTARMHIICPQE